MTSLELKSLDCEPEAFEEPIMLDSFIAPPGVPMLMVHPANTIVVVIAAPTSAKDRAFFLGIVERVNVVLENIIFPLSESKS
jgi:hypothetical protein